MNWVRFTQVGEASGAVIEAFRHDVNPGSLFPPEWLWIEAPDEARFGSTFDGDRWDHSDAVALPEQPEPEQPTTEPLVLGRLQFIVLCQTAGGMTDAMLVAAQKNPAFEAFWIKYQMASAVERDDPITRGALDALAAGGYLPNGKVAVVAAWPTS